MKKFTKLALASSVALCGNAMAMQAMDDAALSATTGQDGLSIGIGISKITIDQLFIHDNDGLAAKGTLGVTPGSGGTGTAGAIVIKGASTANAQDIFLTNLGNTKDDTKKISTADFGVYIGANYSDNGAYLLQSRNLADLTIDTDGSADGAFLNVAAQVSGLEIHLGEIGVTASNDKPDASATSIRRGGKLEGATANYNAILSGLSILTGKMDANIQLGAAPQGAMIKLETVMIGGLEIKNLGILDNSTKGKAVGSVNVGGNPVAVATREAGEIFIDSIKITDANSKDLKINQDIQVFNNAYVGSTDTVGKAAHIRIVSNDTGSAKDQYIAGIHLGSRTANSIGDMEVQGLQTYYSKAMGEYTKGAVITISGK